MQTSQVSKYIIEINQSTDRIVLKPIVIYEVIYNILSKTGKKLKKPVEISRKKIKAFTFLDEAREYRRELNNPKDM